MWRMAAVIGSSVWVLGASPAEAGLFGGPPWSYIAEPIEGRVVDQATGQPIEGVVVVAQWMLARPPEGDPSEPWVVIEAVTDAEGRYRIPGWGPKRRPWFRWFNYVDPELVLFKPGYWVDVLPNGPRKAVGYFNPTDVKVRKAYWNGRDIPLWPFRLGAPISEEQKTAYGNPYPDKEVVTEAEWADQLTRLQNAINWSRMDDEDGSLDNWERVHNLVQMINQECRRLPAKYQRWIHRAPTQYHAALLGEMQTCP
jgi:hypothetical protein